MKIDSTKSTFFRLTAVIGLVLISGLILFQGFHHHSPADNANCEWYNLSHSGLYLLILFLLHAMNQGARPGHAFHAFEENKRSIFLTLNLMSLPPPTSA